MAIDICALLFLFIFGFSKRIHVFVSKTFNKIRKTFKLSYLTKTEIIDKYKINAVMKREFLSSLKDWKTSLSAFIILLTLSFYSYLCLYICVQMLNNDSSYVVKFMNVFSSANIANTANKFIPLPSGEGGIEICLIRTLTAGDSIFKNGNSIDDDYTKLLINSSSLL
jgi:uncharacterized membrane protein YbhN (UPF0104 family)